MSKNVTVGIAGLSGKMGQAIYEVLSEYPNLTLNLTLSRKTREEISDEIARGETPQAKGFCLPVDEHVKLTTLQNIKNEDMPDVVLDFTRPGYTINLLKKCVETNTALITGTTGFSEIQLGDIRAAANKVPILVSANMSLGMNIVASMLSATGKSLYQHADVEVIETHHCQKVDAPSGTAKMLGQIIAATAGVNLEDKAVMSREGDIGERKAGSIGFSTVRGGDVIGEHTVSFFLAGERIELTHRATDRLIFARGACVAAEFLASKPAGLYSMQDVLEITTGKNQ